MKSSSIILFLFILLSVTGYTQDVWTNKSRALPDDLRKVPVAIYLMHSPNPNFPELNTTGTHKEHKYVWKHATSVISPNEDLEVIKAGSFIWYSPEGWIRNTEYSRKQFADRFDCPKGVLKKGVEYRFKENYRWGSNLYGGDALWNIIAKDNDGNIFKGMALLETEAELLTTKQ